MSQPSSTSSTVQPRLPERPEGFARVRLHLLVDLVVAEVHGECDLPPLDGFELVRDLQLGADRADVVGVRPRHHVLHQRAVGDAPGHGPVVQQRFPGVRPVDRVAAERRLVAEMPAARRRHADRAAAVGAVGERRHASRHRRRSAARRATGAEVQVPRVPRVPPQIAAAMRRMGHLRRGRPRMHDRARLQQARHGRHRAIGNMVFEHARAEGRDLAFHRVKVLDDDRNAFEGARLGAGRIEHLGLLRLLQRALVEGIGVGVDRGD